MITLLRAVAGLALGIVVVVGLLLLLVVVNIFQRLEDPEVYSVAVSETGVYSRIYDEVLVDEALKEQTGRLLGYIDIGVHDRGVGALREVMPPSYLQEQTEDNIDRFTGFLRHDRDRLEIYFTLKEPLERVEPVVLGEIHQYIDDLEVVDPPSQGCSLQTLRRLAAATAAPYSRLSEGELPQSAPSLQILSRECREREFDRWFDLVVNDPSLNSYASLILGDEREELRRTFVEGDTRGFLKVVAEPLVEPLVESAVEDVRRNLPPNERFDLLEWLTAQPGGPNRAEIDEWAEWLRQGVSAATGPGRLIALAMVILGSLLLAAVHLPRPPAMLRWPGITLLTGGGVCLVVGLLLNSVVPGRVRDGVTLSVSYSSDVPASAIDLAGDLLESFARQATGGFIGETVAVMVVGAVLLAASLYWDGITSRAKNILGKSGP